MKTSYLSLVLLSFLFLGAAPATKPGPGVVRGLAVQPGDRLGVSVFELVTPGLPWEAELTVDGMGRVTIPNLGAVPVAGLTTVEIKDLIEKKLMEGCMGVLGRPAGPGPQVNVQFANFI